MITIETEIEIEAPPTRVWEVLTDFAAFPEWNPFIRRIAGVPREGERLDVLIQPAGRQPMRFRPRVLRADPPHELRWRGRVVLPGLFDGEHRFRLRRTDAGGTLLQHSETFSGLFVRFAPASLWRGTRIGFESMNTALASRATQVDPGG